MKKLRQLISFATDDRPPSPAPAAALLRIDDLWAYRIDYDPPPPTEGGTRR